MVLWSPAIGAAGAEGSAVSPPGRWLAAASQATGASEAPTCRVDDPAHRSTAADTGAKLAGIRALLAAEAAESDARDVVVLSNRGYNYGSDAVVDPALIEFEAGRQER
jgi:hypothetical protein